ncbi:HepT-like ribonuclease domain-containing protein [uncultured Oscillibacter sp.]|uniref:HepT-like ribonuclease domain-containing protein n=1 Tax=uncultured Oscillibacter sp. TaxID=876091 RepID=UPI002637F079|nr:HepT-like ribonuclease domain-containing protein [uncultured Oscillibacter sp.]
MNKIYTLPELQLILSPIFAQHGVRSAILFGSYAAGGPTERSDVDILVDSGLRGLAFYGLLESVVSALKIPVDLIDVTQVEKIRLWITKSKKAGCRSLDYKDISVLRKLQQHTETIQRYCAAYKSLADFEMDSMCVEATVFNLTQIGESAKTSLNAETKAQITSIPWQQLYGMRNRIVHGYAGIHMQIVWDTVAEGIPKLNVELGNILKKVDT